MEKKRTLIIIFSVIIVFLIAGTVLAWWFRAELSQNYSGEYQAVFLSNDQVYFGKIVEKNSEYLILADVYYLKINKDLQGTREGEAENSELSLVKLGDELHGPRDMMEINKDHVLYIEDLKNTGQVVETIKGDK